MLKEAFTHLKHHTSMSVRHIRPPRPGHYIRTNFSRVSNTFLYYMTIDISTRPVRGEAEEAGWGPGKEKGESSRGWVQPLGEVAPSLIDTTPLSGLFVFKAHQH